MCDYETNLFLGEAFGPYVSGPGIKLPPLCCRANEGRETENTIPAHSQHLDPKTQLHLWGVLGTV